MKINHILMDKLDELKFDYDEFEFLIASLQTNLMISEYNLDMLKDDEENHCYDSIKDLEKLIFHIKKSLIISERLNEDFHPILIAPFNPPLIARGFRRD